MTCTKCKVKKEEGDFSYLRTKGRYASWCKQCHRDYSAAWGQRPSRQTVKRDYRKQRKEELRSRGICIYCQVRPADPALKSGYCRECRRQITDRRLATMRGAAPYRQHAAPCILCGFEYSDVHHVNGDKSDNSPQNCIPLCPNHHRLLHKGLIVLTVEEV